MRRDHLHAPLPQRGVQRIAVVRLVPDQVRRRVLRERQVQRQLHQRRLVRVRRMRAQRQRKPATVHDRHDLHALARLGLPHARRRRPSPARTTASRTPPSRRTAPLLRLARQVLEHRIEHARPYPGLKSPVNGLLVRIALRKKAPLRAGVQNPKHRLEDAPGRHHRPPTPSLRLGFLGKAVANPLPLLVAQITRAAYLKTTHRADGAPAVTFRLCRSTSTRASTAGGSASFWSGARVRRRPARRAGAKSWNAGCRCLGSSRPRPAAWRCAPPGSETQARPRTACTSASATSRAMTAMASAGGVARPCRNHRRTPRSADARDRRRS